jgi:hypothetical protein
MPFFAQFCFTSLLLLFFGFPRLSDANEACSTEATSLMQVKQTMIHGSERFTDTEQNVGSAEKRFLPEALKSLGSTILDAFGLTTDSDKGDEPKGKNHQSPHSKNHTGQVSTDGTKAVSTQLGSSDEPKSKDHHSPKSKNQTRKTSTNGTKTVSTELQSSKLPRKPVLWMHISKNAGTTMCHQARAVGERVVMPSNNCDLPDDNAHWGHEMPPVVSCAKHVAEYQRTAATWGAIDRPLTKDDWCNDNFVYGIIVRNPVVRLESYMNFVGLPMAQIRQWMKCIMHGRRVEVAANLQDATLQDGLQTGVCPPCIPNQVAYDGTCLTVTEVDNNLVRYLAGHEVQILPPGAINSTHVELALKHLTKVDLAVPLEHLDDAPVRAAMDKTLGWHVPPWNHANPHPHTMKFTAEDISTLRKINQYDIEIYNAVAKQYSNDWVMEAV